eukprot:3347555-Lingulodinium_polyedra.AAC.1
MDGSDMPTASGSPRSYGPFVGVTGRPAGSSGDPQRLRSSRSSVSVDDPPDAGKRRPSRRG